MNALDKSYIPFVSIITAVLFSTLILAGCTAKQPLTNVDPASYAGIDDFLAKRTKDYLLMNVVSINNETYYTYKTQQMTYTIFRDDIKNYCASLGGEIIHSHHDRKSKQAELLVKAVNDLGQYIKEEVEHKKKQPPYPAGPYQVFPDTYVRTPGSNQFNLILNAFDNNAVGRFQCKKDKQVLWIVDNIIFYFEQPKRNYLSMDTSSPTVKFLGNAVFVE